MPLEGADCRTCCRADDMFFPVCAVNSVPYPPKSPPPPSPPPPPDFMCSCKFLQLKNPMADRPVHWIYPSWRTDAYYFDYWQFPGCRVNAKRFWGHMWNFDALMKYHDHYSCRKTMEGWDEKDPYVFQFYKMDGQTGYPIYKTLEMWPTRYSDWIPSQMAYFYLFYMPEDQVPEGRMGGNRWHIVPKISSVIVETGDKDAGTDGLASKGGAYVDFESDEMPFKCPELVGNDEWNFYEAYKPGAPLGESVAQSSASLVDAYHVERQLGYPQQEPSRQDQVDLADSWGSRRVSTYAEPGSPPLMVCAGEPPPSPPPPSPPQPPNLPPQITCESLVLGRWYAVGDGNGTVSWGPARSSLSECPGWCGYQVRANAFLVRPP